MHAEKQKRADRPVINMGYSIVPPEAFPYTESIDNDYQYHGDGEGDIMFRQVRPTLASALLLSFMLLLSACGSNGAGTETAASQPSPSAAATASAEPQTRKVQTVNGEVEIPVHPQRIVAGEYLGSLIALGITPVGTSDHHIKNPYFQEYLKDVENIGDGNGNAEKILALKPDLIIMDDFYPEVNEQLAKIAPTVVIPYASLKTVHEEVAYFGELLGAKEKADAWLADYDSRIASAKERVLKAVPADSTFSVIELNQKRSDGRGNRLRERRTTDLQRIRVQASRGGRRRDGRSGLGGILCRGIAKIRGRLYRSDLRFEDAGRYQGGPDLGLAAGRQKQSCISVDQHPLRLLGPDRDSKPDGGVGRLADKPLKRGRPYSRKLK
ncbi:ABC transporter substrate-binding protein [Cohnella rhizosphaerae]